MREEDMVLCISKPELMCNPDDNPKVWACYAWVDYGKGDVMRVMASGRTPFEALTTAMEKGRLILLTTKPTVTFGQEEKKS